MPNSQQHARGAKQQRRYVRLPSGAELGLPRRAVSALPVVFAVGFRPPPVPSLHALDFPAMFVPNLAALLVFVVPPRSTTHPSPQPRSESSHQLACGEIVYPVTKSAPLLLLRPLRTANPHPLPQTLAPPPTSACSMTSQRSIVTMMCFCHCCVLSSWCFVIVMSCFCHCIYVMPHEPYDVVGGSIRGACQFCTFAWSVAGSILHFDFATLTIKCSFYILTPN